MYINIWLVTLLTKWDDPPSIYPKEPGALVFMMAPSENVNPKEDLKRDFKPGQEARVQQVDVLEFLEVPFFKATVAVFRGKVDGN